MLDAIELPAAKWAKDRIIMTGSDASNTLTATLINGYLSISKIDFI